MSVLGVSIGSLTIVSIVCINHVLIEECVNHISTGCGIHTLTLSPRKIRKGSLGKRCL